MLKLKLVSILLLLGLLTHAQFKISGTITDENDSPLIGASVQIKGSTKGTQSNQKGYYEITNLDKGNYTLLVSFIGYEKAEKALLLDKDVTLNISLPALSVMTEEVIVASTRANKNTPTTYTTVDKEAIEKQNLGQDIPYLLSMEPSVVTTSDAGAGIGYTGMWIRGSNIQRINVTVNGIPLNDSESHGVFWVNMPDFSTSVNSIQVQRGVGTSTNGGGAFGATINLETNTVEKETFAEINSSAGSFNTFKNNVRFGTGLIKNKWAFEGRLSKISTDGYVDRASSDLKSYFVQGGYYTDETTVKAVVFSGKEKTYQAWWGVDEWTMENLGRTYNWAGAIFNDDGTTSFYDNQTDNYQQDHYQLHFSHKLNSQFNVNAALHYTYGRGYYEEYNQGAHLGDYGLDYLVYYDTIPEIQNDTASYSDLVTRRWLDNHFYGATYSMNYTANKINLTFGGAANKYANAKHYGEVIWTKFAQLPSNNHLYYDNVSNKTDINNYFKINYQITNTINLFADMQARMIDYTGEGEDSDGTPINIDKNYFFFNPKGGFSYVMPQVGTIYGSVALSQREPIRTDFLDAPNGITPQPEKLIDFELGIRRKEASWYYNANGYFMKYTNQLALTGEINDVGSPIRTNTGESSRTGIELDGGIKPSDLFAIRVNAALSTTSTDFKEQVYDDEGQLNIVEHNGVQLSFSPQAIVGGVLSIYPIKNGEISLNGKYISKQYMDLTQNEDHVLDAYITSQLSFRYSIYPDFMNKIDFSLMINNVLNLEYATNGYMWGIPYYYPQAGINFLAGVSMRF